MDTSTVEVEKHTLTRGGKRLRSMEEKRRIIEEVLRGEESVAAIARRYEVNANLVKLNEEFRLSYIADLVARKQSGENTTLQDADVAFYQREYARLRIALQAAHDASQLPELPSDETRNALNDLLVRVRVKGFN